MDLTLNNVVQTSTTVTMRSANRLISVPGGSSGPGGVLILADGFVGYHQEGEKEDLVVELPRRCPSFGRADKTKNLQTS
jgi:hypothetical protein